MATPVHSWKKRGYTTREAASYIGRSPSWLRKKRLRGLADPGDPGPRWLSTEGGTIYLIESLDEWLNSLAIKAGLSRLARQAPSEASVPPGGP